MPFVWVANSRRKKKKCLLLKSLAIYHYDIIVFALKSTALAHAYTYVPNDFNDVIQFRFEILWVHISMAWLIWFLFTRQQRTFSFSLFLWIQRKKKKRRKEHATTRQQQSNNQCIIKFSQSKTRARAIGIAQMHELKRDTLKIKREENRTNAKLQLAMNGT